MAIKNLRGQIRWVLWIKKTLMVGFSVLVSQRIEMCRSLHAILHLVLSQQDICCHMTGDLTLLFQPSQNHIFIVAHKLKEPDGFYRDQ